MKSFCVLNKPLKKEMCSAIGSAAAYAFGDKIGVAHGCGEHSAKTAEALAGGIKSAGAVAMIFGIANESRVSFLVSNYSLSAFFFVSDEGFVSVYNENGKPLNVCEEDEMASLISSDNSDMQYEGDIVVVNSDGAYLKALVKAAGNLEDIAADIVSENTVIKSILSSALALSGGNSASKPRFFVSRSGSCLCAYDERSRILTHEVLLNICCAFKIKERQELTVSFSAPITLDKLAEKYGVKLNRSFEGGNLPWQSDALFLVMELLCNMAVCGMGLASAYDMIEQTCVVRKNIVSDRSMDDLADMIECNELVLDDSGGVYVGLDGGKVLLTPCHSANRYCMEVAAADSETANELAASLAELLST